MGPLVVLATDRLRADVATLAPSAILKPFLSLIRSPSTSGPITSLALHSLHTLLLHVPVLHTADAATLHALTSTLAACRFPSSSPSQDELVLLRLLKVIECVMCGPLEVGLSDEGVCELLEVGLGMGARPRLSGEFGLYPSHLDTQARRYNVPFVVYAMSANGVRIPTDNRAIDGPVNRTQGVPSSTCHSNACDPGIDSIWPPDAY